MGMPEAFEALQSKLPAALDANVQGSTTPHVLIALPSYSVSESLLSHYLDRVASLEHRYLMALLIAGRIEACDVVYVSTRRPEPEIIDYYVSLVPTERQAGLRRRIRFFEVPDDGRPRSVAARLVDRPDLVAAIREHVGDRLAFIEPWNVTEHEVNLAVALGVPINGTPPEARTLGFKSEGRRRFRAAGVPVPLGREDVHSVDDVVEAVRGIRAAHPDAPGVVVKHDDSGAGDGNVVIDLADLDREPNPDAWVAATVNALPEWYLHDLALGGVVEERIAGSRFSSPSAQVDIRPTGEVRVLATHEQVLGGPSGQVYLGCRFPADGGYAPELARHAAAVGAELGRHGALGRFAVDFVAAGREDGGWDVYAIEVNLRKGGTTHPYATLRNLVPGRYDPEAGQWVANLDGGPRFYNATDNLVDPRWLGLAPRDVIAGVRDAGLQFDGSRGTGTVLHMLSGLGIDGRIGLVAIGRTRDEAAELEAGVRAVMDRLCQVPRRTRRGAPVA